MVQMTTFVKSKPISKSEAISLAMKAGFMLSTQYGQDSNKLMPVTDSQTLMDLIKAIEQAHGIR